MLIPLANWMSLNVGNNNILCMATIYIYADMKYLDAMFAVVVLDLSS